MLKLEVDGLQQQKITSGSIPVSQNQESEATVGAGSPLPGLIDLDFIHDMQMVGSEFGMNSMNLWT